MGVETAISWCDHTFNPWIGCTKVSAACDFCYAEEWAKRYRPAEGLWAGNRMRTSASNWAEPFKWDRQAKRDGIRRRVFCASLADWLDNQAPDQWREDLAVVIEETPHLDWLLLTKRPQNFDKHAPWNDEGDIPPNVWLGITAENQAEYDRRWPHLKAITHRHKLFISYEPALGLLDILSDPESDIPDWVICGGESGAHARPMDPAWARAIRDQCQIAGIWFHFKQWGEWAPGEAFGLMQDGPITTRSGDVRNWMRRHVVCADRADRLDAHSFTEHATDLVYRVGKKAAGRLLDGRTWDEFPEAA